MIILHIWTNKRIKIQQHPNSDPGNNDITAHYLKIHLRISWLISIRTFTTKKVQVRFPMIADNITAQVKVFIHKFVLLYPLYIYGQNQNTYMDRFSLEK